MKAMVLLSEKNAHKRDANISFVDETHSYYYDKEWKFPLSCTGFVHRYFSNFNADEIIKKMMKSKNWKSSKYFGMSPDEIKKSWDDNRDKAATLGTLMHNTIEDFYNLETQEDRNKFEWDPRIDQEFKYFLNYYKEYENLKPYRTEAIVYAKELGLAGSIDMLYIDEETNEMIIVDWKRSKEIKYDNRFQNGIGPCSHLPDTNYIHYSLQLNFYKYILENYYDFKVKSLHLVVCHPDNEDYIKIDVDDFQKEIESMINEWIKDQNF